MSLCIHLKLSVTLLIFRNVAFTEASGRIMQLPLSLGFKGDVEKTTVSTHNKTVVCMLDSWSHWRKGEGAFELSYIDPSLCSQIIYRNAGIDNTTFKMLIRDQQLAENLGWLREFTGLSKTFPHLKLLLSVGGWSEGSSTFSKISSDYKKRQTFVESVVRVLRQYGFHGLDFAWEYPTWKLTNGEPSDRDNLPLLLKELRDTFSKEYLLTLTVTGDRFLAREAYDIKAIVDYVDQFNLRTFDFSGAWNGQAYHQSALFDSKSHQSVESTVKFYLEGGVPANKIILGIPLYGRTFKLTSTTASTADVNGNITEISGLWAPSNGGFGGEWVGDNSYLGYNELCKIILEGENDWKGFWDNFCMVPFARHGSKWVSFDSPESINSKVEFLLQKGLQGVMAWAIDTDDFRGTTCGKNNLKNEKLTYPLLRSINYAIFQEQQKHSRQTTENSKIADEGENNEGKYRMENEQSDKQLPNTASDRFKTLNFKLTIGIVLSTLFSIFL